MERSLLDQAHVAGIGDPGLRAGDVGPRQANLLQEAVEPKPGAPKVVGDVGGPPGFDHLNPHK